MNSLFSWASWEPEMFSTLVFIRKAGKILLIRKKRGLGSGMMNAPGGKIEKNETPLEGAIRETIEEICVEPLGIKKAGELWFHMSDIPDIYCHVFQANDFKGEIQETEEAIPKWVAENKIPYDEMWEDDRYWLPFLFEGEKFVGKFIFQEKILLKKEILINQEAKFRSI